MDTLSLAGLVLSAVRTPEFDTDPQLPVVLLLHGYAMRAADLAPFGASLGVPGLFLFPEGTIDLKGEGRTGRAWWSIDAEAREQAIARGDERDLSAEHPPGLATARGALSELLREIAARWPGRPLFLGGFSQGALLALDLTLRAALRPAGLVLLSGGRVTADEWAPLMTRMNDLHVFQSHGRSDRELSFKAALALQRELVTAGAAVTFRAFDGVHEIPLPVLRDLKKFLKQTLSASTPVAETC